MKFNSIATEWQRWLLLKCMEDYCVSYLPWVVQWYFLWELEHLAPISWAGLSSWVAVADWNKNRNIHNYLRYSLKVANERCVSLNGYGILFSKYKYTYPKVYTICVVSEVQYTFIFVIAISRHTIHCHFILLQNIIQVIQYTIKVL